MQVFISQPMKGLSEKEIKSNREKAIKKIKSLYGDDIEIIDSYIDDRGTPLWCLVNLLNYYQLPMLLTF